MLTRSELIDLARHSTPAGVSVFLPTAVRGPETQQGPIRLKNMVAQARELLSRRPVGNIDPDHLLAPASDLLDDRDFWQHQHQGLALFLDDEAMRLVNVPFPLVEQVVVGRRFHLKPLLRLFTSDGTYRVVTLTARGAKLYTATKFSFREDDSVPIPDVDAASAESDYENPVQAPPVARPNTGSVNIANAQVYGDAPPEWRTSQLVDFARKVAAAVDVATSRQRVPVVLAADAELGGHFQKSSDLGPLLAGVIEGNSDTLTPDQLHEATYSLVLPWLDEGRQRAMERWAALRGRGDPRAVTAVSDVLGAAAAGRVETSLVRMEHSLWGQFDADSGEVAVEGPASEEPASAPAVVCDLEDLYERAALLTLQLGGEVHVLEAHDLPDVEFGAALLRH